MIVGIDLGTTNSLIGAMDSGFPVLFADEEGRRLTPSAVLFSQDGEPVAGWEALSHPESLRSIKRLMGRRVGEVVANLPVEGTPGQPVQVRTSQGRLTPEDISALILKKLKAHAERALGQTVDRAVITVPAFFNDAQRAATKKAGELAGLQVERLLAEPTAAALAYGLDRLGDKSHVAVFDLGGGTFDVSVLELSDGVFHVLSTNGDTQLGGDDFDRAIAAGFGISQREAEDLKKNSDDPLISQLCRPIIERTRQYCMRSLHDAGLKAEQLDEIILVGGATRMPLVREFVREIFGKEPNTSQHPDEAVAIGAVIQAGILDGAVQNVTLLDVTPLSLGIETFGGLMNVLIPRNTTIPCRAGEMFANAVSNQTSMRISVLQGEREMARDNWTLGEFEIAFSPAPRGQARVGVQFEIDANGLLNVLVRDISTGRDTQMPVQSAVEVSDEAVEKMLADSLEHAFEDMDERIFTEACLKADEMVPAVARALDELAGDVSAEERTQIAVLIDELKVAREAHSYVEMKAVLNKLDLITEPLAALLLERAMAQG